MTKDRLIYVPLGGAGEIGMNAYVYGWGPAGEERLIVVDLGVTFGDMETSPGIDLIMADIDWLADNAAELQKMGLPPQALQMFEPWFVGLTISITEMTKQGLDPKLGLDAHLAAQAGKAGKPTAGLETGAQQIAFLDGMGKQEQLQFLAEALSQSKDAKSETAKLHDAWREGNAELLWNDMAVKMKQEYPGLYQRINVARNDAWVPKIEKRLADPGTDDTLVVVGALHLLGPDGVVEKLRTKGYTVERVCSACALGK